MAPDLSSLQVRPSNKPCEQGAQVKFGAPGKSGHHNGHMERGSEGSLEDPADCRVSRWGDLGISHVGTGSKR